MRANFLFLLSSVTCVVTNLCPGVHVVAGYHWDCSDWARPSQNPLPNIMEVPGGEVRDSSSYHSNESNESIVVKPAENQPLMPPGRLVRW